MFSFNGSVQRLHFFCFVLMCETFEIFLLEKIFAVRLESPEKQTYNRSFKLRQNNIAIYLVTRINLEVRLKSIIITIANESSHVVYTVERANRTGSTSVSFKFKGPIVNFPQV